MRKSAVIELSRAKELLKDDVTLALVGREEIVRRERGIAPLIALLEEKRDVRGYAAADRIVGKAAAFLYVLLGVGAVYAEVMSAPAEEALSRFRIPFEAKTHTERIINRAGTGLCPMECAVEGIGEPADALPILQRKLAELRRGGEKKQ